MNSYVLSFQEIDRHKLMAVGVKAPTLENYPELREYEYRRAFALRPKHTKNNQRNTGIRLIVGAIVPAKGRRQTENQ